MLSNSFVYGQLKSFGTKAKNKPEPNYHYSVYGYYDLVREIGIGAQFQIQNKWNLDVSVYNVRSSEYFKAKVRQEDYHDFSGYGMSIKPKFLLGSLNRTYIGVNINYEYLHHDALLVDRSGFGLHHTFRCIESASGNVFTLGATAGHKMLYKHMFVEPFLCAGVVFNKTTATVYEANTNYLYPNKPFPLSYQYNGNFLHFNIGIKVGYSFKNISQKREAINKKFDVVYIPKTDSLMNYFNTVGVELIEKSANLMVARDNYNQLNRRVLSVYRMHYRDTSVFYIKVDDLYKFLYQKINTHYAIQKKQTNVYNPKNEALQAYFNTIDFKDENTSKYLKRAYTKFKKTEALNLLKYNTLSTDTIKLYQFMDGHYHKIETLISKAKQ